MNKKIIFFVFFLIFLFYLNKMGIVNYKNRGYCNLCLILYGSIVFYSIIKDDVNDDVNDDIDDDVNDDIDDDVNDDIDDDVNDDIIEGFCSNPRGIPICGEDDTDGTPTHNHNRYWIRGDTDNPDKPNKPDKFFETSNNLWYYTNTKSDSVSNQDIIDEIMERKIYDNNVDRTFNFNDGDGEVDVCQCPCGTVLRAIADSEQESDENSIIWGCIPSCEPVKEHKHFDGSCVCSINVSGDFDRHVMLKTDYVGPKYEEVTRKTCENNKYFSSTNSRCLRDQYIQTKRRGRIKTCENYPETADTSDPLRGPCRDGEERYYDGNCVCSKGNYRTRNENGELVCEPSNCPNGKVRISDSNYLSKCVDINHQTEGCKLPRDEMGRCNPNNTSDETCKCQNCKMNRHCRLNYSDYILEGEDETCSAGNTLHNSWCEPNDYTDDIGIIEKERVDDSGTANQEIPVSELETDPTCIALLSGVRDCEPIRPCYYDRGNEECFNGNTEDILVDCKNIDNYLDFIINDPEFHQNEEIITQCVDYIKDTLRCGSDEPHICEQSTPEPSRDPICEYLEVTFGPRSIGSARTNTCLQEQSVEYCMVEDENGNPIDPPPYTETDENYYTNLSCCNIDNFFTNFINFAQDPVYNYEDYLESVSIDGVDGLDGIHKDVIDRVRNCQGYIRGLYCSEKDCATKVGPDALGTV